MAFFKKKKQEATKMTTLEEVRKAYEDLSEEDKKRFDEGRAEPKQTVQDRIDESLGEQEAEHGQKDSQSAKDREDEALGAEHADGKGDVKELHATDPVHAEWRGKLDERLSKLEESLSEIMKKYSTEDKLQESKMKYGFAPRAGKLDEGEKLTPEQAMERLRRA